MSDPRPPDDGPSWPERDLDERRPEEPAEGWSDDPYRYEPPPAFKPSYEMGAEGERPRSTPGYPAEHPFADENPFPDEPPPRADEPWQRRAEEQRFEEPPAEEPPEQEPPAPVREPAEEPPMEEPPDEQPAEEPDTRAAEAVMAFEGGGSAWDPKLHGNRRRPTTAEQAVPWMIGIILALTGMVIVLLALIFSSPNGLVAGQPSSTPLPSASADASTAPSTAPSEAPASPSAEPSASTEPTPDPSPTYGPLEMLYLGRPTPAAPIYLLRRDFSEDADPRILAQADQGVTKFAWSPDGSVGAAIISGRAIALTPGQETRRLADNIRALTFGWDNETVYAVRIARDGANDRAQILEIDFVSRATDVIATIRYRHPVTGPEAPLREAQFIDDGGLVRIYAVADGNLAVWILGAPSTYRVDPASGDVTDIAREPVLWSPDGAQRVTLHESGSNTTLRLRNRSGDVAASVTVNGLVSHVRWAGTSNEIVFTLGRVSATGGVRQDLYVWDLRDRRDPAPLTSNGASFGADWRGVMANWAP